MTFLATIILLFIAIAVAIAMWPITLILMVLVLWLGLSYLALLFGLVLFGVPIGLTIGIIAFCSPILFYTNHDRLENIAMTLNKNLF